MNPTFTTTISSTITNVLMHVGNTAVSAVSPITLYLTWSSLSRLVTIFSLTALALIVNTAFVGCFFVEASLKKIGNIFVCCVGVTELINVALVLPTAFIVLISQEIDEIPACHFIEFAVIACGYANMLFCLFISVENYTRIRRYRRITHGLLTSERIANISASIVVLSCSLAAIGCFNNFYYDYCERKHTGRMFYRLALSLSLYGLPCLLTLIFLASSACHISSRARHSQYRHSMRYDYERKEVALNIKMYLTFILTWLPYLIIIYIPPKASDLTFYNLAWLGYLRTIFSGTLYILSDKMYRQAFNRVMIYVCCKISLHSRQQRILEGRVTNRDVRVHIMHEALNMNNQRRALTPRDNVEL